MVMNDRFVAWIEMPADPTEAGLYGFDLAKREKFLITHEFINTDVAEDRRQLYHRAIHGEPGDIRIRRRGARVL